jgi:hypothetical protein
MAKPVIPNYGRKSFVPNTLPNFHFISDYQIALDSPLKWVGKTETFIVPKGFVSDFATVPKFLWWLFGPTGKYTAAAILHDWLCTLLGTRCPPASARDTDGIFRRRCKELGVDYVSRWLLWTGVRWGALFNEKRRAGWWRDAPLVIVWSVLALVPVLIATVGVLVGLGIIGILRAVAHLARLT